MHRPVFTSADRAVLRSAEAKSAAHSPRAPQLPQPDPPRPFWGLLAQKLSALLAENPLLERNERRGV